jgi:hypothetical protein
MGLNKDRITSLELLDQINIFRKQEGNRAELQHKDLLKIIRNEFEEEINEGKISLVEYKDKKGELRPMYILTYNQAKQVLLRESKFVRRAVIHYVERLEEELQKDFIEKYERQLLGFDELVKRNEELEYNNGNGKYYKSIYNIKWWKDYFILDKKGLGRKLTEELIRLSGELNIAYDGIYPTFSNNEVLVFHVKTYEEFRKRLINDTEFRILPAYRKRF